jgi:hypothetical protein
LAEGNGDDKNRNLSQYQNSIFVTVNNTIQVKVITKVIYISVSHDMFLPYWVIVRCIPVYLDAEFLFIFDHMIM